MLASSAGDALTLKYGDTASGGPRVYLIEPEGTNKNTMFKLEDQEFSFDMELSSMPCGFNAALYFVGMAENEGGAENGTNYCDAQAVAGTFCSEVGVLESNTQAQQHTRHACVDACGSFSAAASECQGTGSPSTVCDQNGCGLNPFRYGPGTQTGMSWLDGDYYVCACTDSYLHPDPAAGQGHLICSQKIFFGHFANMFTQILV